MVIRRLPATLSLVLCLAVLNGCRFTNHAYRLQTPVVQLAPPTGPDPTPPSPPPDARCNKDTGYAIPGSPCLAFIEFDDTGAPFARDPDNGADLQTKHALDLIQRTRIQYPDGSNRSPVILLFVHGWKHNASENDANVQAFQNVLRYLAGQKVSQISEDSACPNDRQPVHVDLTNPGVLPGRCVFAKHPIIGIYIGWRGDLVNNYFPVLQDLSFYDRELGANRVGKSDGLTSAIAAISKASRQQNPGSTEDKPILILSGHSFGGLILERSITQTFSARLENPLPDGSVDRIADLVLLVNPASPGEISWPLMNLLAQKQVEYCLRPLQTVPPAQAVTPAQSKCVDPQGNRIAPEPLILSVTTTADAATKIIMPTGRFVENLPPILTGSFRTDSKLACFDPLINPAAARHPDQHWEFPYTLESAPHLKSLQSHQFIELMNPEGKSLQACPPNVPVPPGTYFVGSIPGHCYVVRPLPDRCNGTPYWAMETNRDLIPDHGTIFTARFLNFVGRFLPKPVDPDSPQANEPERPRLLLSVPQQAAAAPSAPTNSTSSPAEQK